MRFETDFFRDPLHAVSYENYTSDEYQEKKERLSLFFIIPFSPFSIPTLTPYLLSSDFYPLFFNRASRFFHGCEGAG